MSFQVIEARGSDAALWQSMHDRLPAGRDVHTLPAYMRAQETTPLGGRAHCAIYDAGGWFIMQPFMLRRVMPQGLIKKHKGHPPEWFDMSTPYGFGGPLTNSVEPVLAWLELEREMIAWREKNNIICEFCSLNPMDAAQTKLIEALGQRVWWQQKDTIASFVARPRMDLFKQLSESRQRDVTRAEQSGLHVLWGSLGDTYERRTFGLLYRMTLERNFAGRRWEYPDHVWDFYGKELAPEHVSLMFLVDRDMRKHAAMVLLHGFGVSHVHFIGSDNEHATDLLYLEAMNYSRDIGCQYMHLGGGRSDAADDTLLAYKRRFGEPHKFLSYRRVFNEEVYSEMCEHAGVDRHDLGFFPAYRRVA